LELAPAAWFSLVFPAIRRAHCPYSVFSYSSGSVLRPARVALVLAPGGSQKLVDLVALKIGTVAVSRCTYVGNVASRSPPRAQAGFF
jgi:hypothetical protein